MIRVLGHEVPLPILLELVAAVLAGFATAVLVAVLLQRALTAWARRRGLTADDVAVPIVRRYLPPVVLVGALHATLSALTLPRNLHHVLTRVLSVATLALSLYLTAQIVLALLGRLARRTESGRRVADDLLAIARVALFILSVAILLDNLGVRVTALLTTLGIGSLAVALALQDTLGNFFAGLYLHADRPLRIGDYIRIDTGHEGIVVHVGWRSTHLRTRANNTVVVPNEKLSKAVITNYSEPDPRASFTLTVTVPYATDLERVERLLLEAVERARADVPGLLPDPPPAVRLIPGFDATGLKLSLTGWLRMLTDQEQAEDTIRRHILALFRAAGIALGPDASG